MDFKCKKLNQQAILPTRAHSSDAGIDMYACENVDIEPGDIVSVGTGIQASISDGYVALVWDKSGLTQKGIKTLGGVIDAGYRGEYKIVVTNLSNSTHSFKIGDKIAQILIQKVDLPEIVEVDLLDQTARGARGFGSTGK